MGLALVLDSEGVQETNVSRNQLFSVDSWCFVMNYSILGGRGRGESGIFRVQFFAALMNGVGRGKGVEKAVTVIGE